MKTIAAFGLLAAFTGCAAAMPPQDLVTARDHATTAPRTGPPAQLDPADLHTAKETLDTAEKSFVDNGDTQETRDDAYTADRRTQIAESRARAMQSEQREGATVADMNASQTATVRTTSAALGRANQQLASQGQAAPERDASAAKTPTSAPRRLAADLARIGIGEAGGARDGHHALGERPLRVGEVATSCRTRRPS